MHPFKAYLLGNAVVWATVVLGVTLLLRGTAHSAPVLMVVGGGAVMSLGVLGGALWRRL
ncbi:MAG: hypothetical protein R3325_15535 [Thermoanaerobaculia bacterium]|nr:hypothetical protein [Thermoanaerobaculia bacterium]